MKKTVYILFLLASPFFSQAQEENDTTRIKLGNKELIIVENNKNVEIQIDSNVVYSEGEDIGDEDKKPKKKRSEAHWAGVDFGFTTLLNNNNEASFPTSPFLQNDVAKSQTWNLNILEHKFRIVKQYVGLTTGLGFNFSSVGFRDNYILGESADTLVATVDSINSYSKNKLKATYLTVPLLLEFTTSHKTSKSFYLAAGAVGGVRIHSKVKRVGEYDGKQFKEKLKGDYALNPFKLDAAVRVGYGDWGAFANYSLLPLFDTSKTMEAYPLTFGLSLNF